MLGTLTLLFTTNTVTRSYAFFFPRAGNARLMGGNCSTGKGLRDIVACAISRIGGVPSNLRIRTSCIFGGDTNAICSGNSLRTFYQSNRFFVRVGRALSGPSFISAVRSSLTTARTIVGCPDMSGTPSGGNSSVCFSSTAVRVCSGGGQGSHGGISVCSHRCIAARRMTAPTNAFSYAGMGCGVGSHSPGRAVRNCKCR